MSRTIQQSDYFLADLNKQVDWYRENATSQVAEGYVNAVELTVRKLAKTPAIGRLRFQDWPELAGIRSWRLQRPFHRHLIFYRFNDDTLTVERVLHGARDLPRRLLESPYEPEDQGP